MTTSIPSTHRSRDTAYALFLITHALVIIFFDALTLYPAGVAPAYLLSLHEWYKTEFNDQLIITQSPWFRFFTVIELVYQLPVAVWGSWALWSKSYRAPTHLLILSVVGFGTTIVCLFEFYHNELMNGREKWVLSSMYGGYALAFGVIGLDLFFRIQKILAATTTLQKIMKTQ